MVCKFLALLLLVSTAVNAVKGGFQLKGDEWNGVVHLKSTSGLCSGAVVNQQWIITAAHCVEKQGQSVQVYSGLNADKKQSNAQVVFIDPRYQPTNFNYDVAVLKLNSKTPSSSDFKVSASKIYSYLLNGKYPPREVLVAGYGLSENNQLGGRKGAFEKSLGLYPGANYIGSFFTLNSIGKTRQGDSGGPVFILTPDGHQLFGVVSGENSYVIKDDDGDFKENAVRNAPIASSFCVAPTEIQKGLRFNNSYCQRIKTAEQKLSKPPQSKEDHLWQAALAAGSSLREVESIRGDAFRRVAVSFSKIDNLMARKYIKDHLDIIFTERETIKVIRDTLNVYENRVRDDKYSTGAVLKMKDSAYSSDARIALRKSKIDGLMAKCGSEPCLEAWRTSYPNPGSIRQFSENKLNWGFLTSVKVDSEGLNLATLVCMCHENVDNSNKAEIIKYLRKTGFKESFLGIEKNNDLLEIKGKSNEQRVRLICGKEPFKGNISHTTFIDIKLNKKNQYLDKAKVIERAKHQSQTGSMKTDQNDSTSIMLSSNTKDPDESFSYNSIYKSVLLVVDETVKPNQKSRSVLINQVFQCKN